MYDRLMKLREERRGEKGFTLIELLVVVVIIGVLIGIAVPLYLNYQKSSHDKAAQSDLRNAISVLETCYSDNGAYPTAVAADGALTGCDGQTIKKSDGTTFEFEGSTSSYKMQTKNADGSGKYYFYDSSAGGSVKGFDSDQIS